MIEVCTGRLELDRLDAEVLAVVDDFRAFGHDTVYVTCGFGCDRDLLAQSQDVPVPIARLAGHLAELERLGVFELGEADLFVSAAGVEFQFCHEGDVHCSAAAECPLLSAVRRRWTRSYERSW